MRVLLLNPPHRSGELFMKEVFRCGRRSAYGEVWPQSGLGQLAACVRQRGAEPLFCDAMAERLSAAQTLARATTARPDLVLVLTSTPTFRSDAELGRRIAAETGAPAGLLGTHVSALPQPSLAESGLDFVLVGEPEAAVDGLLAALAGGSFGDSPVHGVLFRQRPGEAVTAVVVDDLDGLPAPARELMPNHLYRTPMTGRRPFATVIAARGCPYGCSFCRSHSVSGRRLRQHSPERVAAEVEALGRCHGIADFAFVADTFTYDREWALAVCERLAGLGGRRRWMCSTRADCLDRELLGKMRQAGCRLLSLGIESASATVRDECSKRLDLAAVRQAIADCRALGIDTVGYFIFGLPGDSESGGQDTIRLALELAPTFAHFHVAVPFPGTPFHRQAVEQGWLQSDDWDAYDQMGDAVVGYEQLPAARLTALRRLAHRRFYVRPGFICSQLRSPHRWPSLWLAAVDQLRRGCRW